MLIGYIGTGNIGEPMAASILDAGFPLVVYDIAEDAASVLARELVSDSFR